MAQAEQVRTLSKFNITETDDAYAIHIEDDAGDIIEFQATPEQIDLIADTLDELLYDEIDEIDEEVGAEDADEG